MIDYLQKISNEIMEKELKEGFKTTGKIKFRKNQILDIKLGDQNIFIKINSDQIKKILNGEEVTFEGGIKK